MEKTIFEIPFRIRGTFIDVDPHAQNFPPTIRRRSVPATTNARSVTDDSSERISSWLGKAKCLHCSLVTSQQVASTQVSGNSHYKQKHVCACCQTSKPSIDLQAHSSPSTIQPVDEHQENEVAPKRVRMRHKVNGSTRAKRMKDRAREAEKVDTIVAMAT